MPEELNPHPAPEVEEDIDGDGDRQQQAVEAQAVAAGAALREVLIHGSREEQTKQRHNGNQSHHHRQGEHSGTSTINPPPDSNQVRSVERCTSVRVRNNKDVLLCRWAWRLCVFL